MSQITNATTAIVSTDTTLANATAATFSQEIDLRQAIGGVLQVEFQFVTAPTGGKSLDFYLLPALASSGDFDVYAQGANIPLGSVIVAAVTTAQRLSIPLDPAKLNVPYGKLAAYNNATGQTVTLKKINMSVRKVA